MKNIHENNNLGNKNRSPKKYFTIITIVFYLPHTCLRLHPHLGHPLWLSGLCVPPQKAEESTLSPERRPLNAGSLGPPGCGRTMSSVTLHLHSQKKNRHWSMWTVWLTSHNLVRIQGCKCNWQPQTPPAINIRKHPKQSLYTRFSQACYLALRSRSLDLDESVVSSSAPHKAAAGRKEQTSEGSSPHLYLNPAAAETGGSENRRYCIIFFSSWVFIYTYICLFFLFQCIGSMY